MVKWGKGNKSGIKWFRVGHGIVKWAQWSEVELSGKDSLIVW